MLDVAQPQVEIEARIVETSAVVRAQPRRAVGLQRARSSTNSPPRRRHAERRRRTWPSRAGGDAPWRSALFGTDLNLDVALSALEAQGQGRILSTPRVSTQNNIEAEITQGIQIPIQTVANNTVTVTFKDAALTLKVTPQITAANTVIMQISVENASPDFSRQVNNIPPIDTQRANTRVQVNNGETTVIGGIYKSREQTNQDRTPGLHRVPLLGWLFKRDTRHGREPRAAHLHHAEDRPAVNRDRRSATERAGARGPLFSYRTRSGPQESGIRPSGCGGQASCPASGCRRA